MTSEERIEKVEELLKEVVFSDSNSKVNEITKEILFIETNAVNDAIVSTTNIELPYLVFALEQITKAYKSRLAVQPSLRNIYAFLNFTFDPNFMTVSMPKPRSKENDK